MSFVSLMETSFVKQGFARFNASRLKGVVRNFYSRWCIIVWYMFMQNVVNFYRSIQKLYGNNLWDMVIMNHSTTMW